MTRKLYNCPLTKSVYDFDSKRVYFWGGVFSQWFESEFRDQGLTFNTAEQAMMYQKAMTFGDRETARLIMGTKDPKLQKALGRRVVGYRDSVWDARRLDIVTRISFLKFMSDGRLKSYMLMLDGWEFVEASPSDRIWGIGLATTDSRIFDKSQWLGQNLLGLALNAAQRQIVDSLADGPTTLSVPRGCS